ncbi:MAG TPA: hypothetical protein VIK33_19555 [Anaerolineae bacterium]
MTRRLPLFFILATLALAACTTPGPTPAPTTIDPTEAFTPTEPPVPTVEPAPKPTLGPTLDPLAGVIRDPVAEADRANAEVISAGDLPIGDLRELSIRMQGLPADTPDKTCTAPETYNVGDQEVFHVSNNDTFEQFDVTATLISIEPNVYMWVDNNWLDLVDRNAVIDAGKVFSEQIVPRDRELFGMEWSPGIDCDPRLFVLHTSNTAAGGYFSSTDEYITAVRKDSNEKEMFYIDLEGIGGPGRVGSSFYLGVLAHEYQHMIHFYIDRNEDTWANEGLSDLAMFLNDYSIGGADFDFAGVPNTQLNFWPEGGGRGANYGAAFTFWLYFYDKYGEKGIQDILADPRNGLDGVAEALKQVGFTGTLDDFFADWVVAKFVDDPSIDDSRYGFVESDPPHAEIAQTLDTFPHQFQGPQRVNQYAAQYYELLGSRDVHVEFTGSTKTRLIDAEPHSGQYFWLNNRGDSADMRLTREVDLTGVSQATLTYSTWFDFEKDWDYGYVTVSTDGGQTYQILKTPSSTDRNPNNNNLGWGYTGDSGGGPAEWIQESVDLTPYAGQTILLRFETVNDLAVNLPGFAIDDIEIPEIGFKDDAETDTGWTAEGWIRTNNYVPQNFIVQVVGFGKDDTTTVMRLPIDADNTGAWDIPLSQWNTGVLIVAATAVKSSEPALFNWTITE